MLNKHNTKVLTLAILLTLGITPKSTAISERAIFFSSRDKFNLLQEYILAGYSNFTIDSKITDSYENNLPSTVIAQDSSPNTSSNNNPTDKNPYVVLWWLAPLIILVPCLGFLLLKTASKSKTQPIDEELTTSSDLPDIAKVYPPTSQNENSESSQNLVDEVEADSPLKRRSTFDSNELKTSPASKSTTVEEELFQSSPDSLTDSEKIESNSARQSAFEAFEAELSQPTLDLAVKSEEITLEEADAITNQELDNISEWLNERIDSTNTDVSSLDDFWDNLDSVNEEISEEITLEEAETITNQELASISEWLDERIDLTDEDLSSVDNLYSVNEESSQPDSNVPGTTETDTDSNLTNTTNDSIDDLFNLIEGIDTNSNEELLEHNLNLIDHKNENIPNPNDNFTSQASELNSDYLEEFNLDEENSTKTAEGINDVTSNFLEELLNEDLNREDKH